MMALYILRALLGEKNENLLLSGLDRSSVEKNKICILVGHEYIVRSILVEFAFAYRSAGSDSVPLLVSF